MVQATACGITGSFPISLGLLTAGVHLAVSTCTDNESGKTGPFSATPTQLWRGLNLGVKKDWPGMCILTKAARDLYKRVGSLTRESDSDTVTNIVAEEVEQQEEECRTHARFDEADLPPEKGLSGYDTRNV